jgi:1-deoxy-D-xylulose-5-phosphate reductoisomerase
MNHPKPQQEVDRSTETPSLQRIAVLGSTGSIGTSTLDVARAATGRVEVTALSARTQLAVLVAQAQEFKPRWVVAADEALAADFDWSGLPQETELLVGESALESIASHAEIDTVVAAIVGSAGLRSTWAAVANGKRVALANKETMVVAGPLVNAMALKSGAQVLPVDSEHSAIFQALAAGRREDVRRIILTASGGPFRTFTAEQLSQVTVEQALDHPTWNMGPKITIDSATMMNKALEIVEARWLFGVLAEQIEVLVHPQSIIHSLVEFVDGSVVAQMSPPDMKLPIQYALSYPERWATTTVPWDRSQPAMLSLEPPDLERFPAIELGLDVARSGGTAGVIMNAANEVAVAEFMAGKMPFLDIVPACRSVLENHQFDPQPTLETLFQLDQWARAEVTRWICTS